MKTSAATRTLLVLATLGLAASPAIAGKRRPAKKKAAALAVAKRPIDYGESFDLSRLDRRASLPRADVERAAAQSLRVSQVGQVIKDRFDDVEYCWLRLPAATRTPTNAVLALAIEPAGTVTAVQITGGVPAEAEQCLTEAAGRWTFPAADAASDVEYPIELK
jgi:hypothetical protein